MSIAGQFIHEKIIVNQNKPESKTGILLAVSNDYFVLYTEIDGIVYFNSQHLISISLQDKYIGNTRHLKKNVSETFHTNDNMRIYPEYLQVSDFQTVFRNMLNKWVSMHLGGLVPIEGVLVENTGGYYTIVNDEEILRISPFLIISLSTKAKIPRTKGYRYNNNFQSPSNTIATKEDTKDNKNNASIVKRKEKEKKKEREKKKIEDDITANKQEIKKDEKKESNAVQKELNEKDVEKNVKKKKIKNNMQESSNSAKRRDNSQDEILKSIDYVWKKNF